MTNPTPGKHLCPKCNRYERCCYEHCQGTCTGCAICNSIEMGTPIADAEYIFGDRMVPPLTPNMFTENH